MRNHPEYSDRSLLLGITRDHFAIRSMYFGIQQQCWHLAEILLPKTPFSTCYISFPFALLKPSRANIDARGSIFKPTSSPPFPARRSHLGGFEIILLSNLPRRTSSADARATRGKFTANLGTQLLAVLAHDRNISSIGHRCPPALVSMFPFALLQTNPIPPPFFKHTAPILSDSEPPPPSPPPTPHNLNTPHATLLLHLQPAPPKKKRKKKTLHSITHMPSPPLPHLHSTTKPSPKKPSLLP